AKAPRNARVVPSNGTDIQPSRSPTHTSPACSGEPFTGTPAGAGAVSATAPKARGPATASRINNERLAPRPQRPGAWAAYEHKAATAAGSSTNSERYARERLGRSGRIPQNSSCASHQLKHTSQLRQRRRRTSERSGERGARRSSPALADCPDAPSKN